VTVVLALLGSLVFGASDFVGGVMSRRIAPLRVAALAQSTALVLAVPIALLAGWERVTWADAGWSLASGVAVAIGLGLFYTGMSRGMISLVVPVTAVIAASIPVVYAVASGERPGVVTFAGIALALVAIAVVSAMPRIHSMASVSREIAVITVAAGACFGAFIVLVDQVNEDAGLWPIVLSRSTSAFGLVALALAFTGWKPEGIGRATPACLAIGALEAVGIVALLAALQRGPLAVASVLLSLYPVGSVLLAMVFLHERLTRHQLAGVVLALCSVVLISAQA